VKCLGCNTHQTVALDIVRRPKTTPVHELERYMRCRQCSEISGTYFPGMIKEEVMADETEIEPRKIQFEAAKLDLEAKRSDLKRRPSDLRNALTSPVAVAAIIAAIVAVSTTIVSSIVTDHQTKLATYKAQSEEKLEAQKAQFQRELEQVKFTSQKDMEERKYESQLIFDAVRTDDPNQAAINLKFLVETGLISGAVALRLAGFLEQHPPSDVKTLPMNPASGRVTVPR
jgi:Tfp pilus assembly major pilin PilA